MSWNRIAPGLVISSLSEGRPGQPSSATTPLMRRAGPTTDNVLAHLFREGNHLVITVEFCREEHLRRHPQHLGAIFLAEIEAEELAGILQSALDALSSDPTRPKLKPCLNLELRPCLYLATESAIAAMRKNSPKTPSMKSMASKPVPIGGPGRPAWA